MNQKQIEQLITDAYEVYQIGGRLGRIIETLENHQTHINGQAPTATVQQRRDAMSRIKDAMNKAEEGLTAFSQEYYRGSVALAKYYCLLSPSEWGTEVARVKERMKEADAVKG